MRRLLLACALLAPPLAACSCDQDAVFSAQGAVAYEPGSLDFGKVFVGERASLDVSFRNDGQADITLVAGTLLGAPTAYSVAPSELYLPAGGAGKLTITFAPEETGEQPGTIPIGASGATNNEVPIAVTGIGVVRAVSTPELLDFGPVAIGTAKELPLPVVSTSEVDFTVEGSIEGTDATMFRLDRGAFDLAAGATGSFAVTFTPRERQPYTATAHLRLCEECSPITVILRGSGAEGSLRPDPELLDFGTLTPGTTRTLTLTLINDGDFPAMVGAAVVQPDPGPDFAADTSGLPMEVAPGTRLEIPVTFAPLAVGSQSGTLRITDGAGGIHFDVPMTGRSGGADLIATPASLDFGVQTAGIASTRQVIVTNVGDLDPVEVFGVRVEGAGAAAYSASADRALPAEVSVLQLAIAVTFRSGDPGIFPAELVIESNDPDEPQLRVPLTGVIRDLPPCDLRIWPTELRFGLVHVGDVVTQEVSLVNRGNAECLVWDLALDPAGAAAFSLPGAVSGTLSIAAGATLPVQVAYAPLVPGQALDRTNVFFTYSNQFAPMGQVPVSAFATDADLVAVPNPVDFGRTPLGYRGSRNFSLLNQGATPVTITGAAMSGGSSADLSIVSAPGAGAVLAAGGSVQYELRYAPLLAGADAGQVEIFLQGAPIPFLVEVLGEGIDEPCGALCEGPSATCPGPMITDVNTQLTMVGSGTDPQGDPLSCSWTVISAPVGSRAALVPPNTCVTTFTPDLVGDYVVELTVRDPSGSQGNCQFRITANARGGLWVETYWDRADDIDLHLLHPTGGAANAAASWMSAPYDCYFANLTPSWDAAGAGDDASLDRDDTVFTGPENTRINTPSIVHGYHVGIHWWANANNHAAIQVTTNIYCGGALTHTDVTTLTRVRDLAVLGEVQYDANGSCTFVRNGTILNL